MSNERKTTTTREYVTEAWGASIWSVTRSTGGDKPDSESRVQVGAAVGMSGAVARSFDA